MLDYPLHFPGSNMTVPWTQTGMSVAVVLVALTVLLLSCCGAAALFLVACCGSRRRDAVAERGESRWLPGVGLIDYVPVSNRSSVRVSLIMSDGSQGPEVPQELRSPSAETLASMRTTSPPTAAVTASPSVLSDVCSIQVQPQGLVVYSVAISSTRNPRPVLVPARNRPHSAPSSPTPSMDSVVIPSKKTSCSVPISSISSQVLRSGRSRSSLSLSDCVARSIASLPAILPSLATRHSSPPSPVLRSPSPVSPPSPTAVSPPPSPAPHIRPPSRENLPSLPSSPPSPPPLHSKLTTHSKSESGWWSTVPESRRPQSTASSL